MKSYYLVLLGLLCIQSAFSQNTSLSQDLSLGFTFAPQAITTFENSEQPFETAAPLYFAAAYQRGKVGFLPFYNFGGNSVGLFLGPNPISPFVPPQETKTHHHSLAASVCEA